MTGGIGLSVLLVDDDPRVRAALTRMLDETEGVHAVALDSDQALRLPDLGAHGVDVAVVDVPYADSPGERLIRALAARLPVVAVSLSGAVRRRVLDAGAAFFVEKDGDAGAVVDAIRRAARSRGAGDAAAEGRAAADEGKDDGHA